MAAEDEVYFPVTGDESHAFLAVRIFSESGNVVAEPSLKGPMAEGADYDFPRTEGEPVEVLRRVREFAGLRGLDVRVQLDGVEWHSDWGTLVA